MNVRRFVSLLLVILASSAFALKTPETSSLFVAHTDTVSQVVSYILKPGILGYHHHQSVYFTSRCMTDDGRFLVFSVSPNEFTEPHPGLRYKAIIDFEKDVAYVMADTRSWYTPWIDVERDQMWYITREGVHRRDLLVDPNKDIVVCPAPPEIRSYGTHLTLSPDRRKIFLDAHKEGVYKQGIINLDTGKWEEWTQAPFCCNHGQFNPVDPTMGMCAFEYAWFLTPNELPPDLRANPPMETPPYVTSVRRQRDHVYPRLWLFRNTGEKWMVPSRITNSASHEIFTWDGTGFYWCGGGVLQADLATERQTMIVPCRAAHATMTEDSRYLVFDNLWGHWYRGGGWTVAFWNRDEHRGTWLYHQNPPMATDKAHESVLHPDPHPMFVCKDKYIVCTAIFPATSGVTNENYMALSVTPVAQLIAKTQARLTPTTPKYFDLPDWRPTADDTPCELALDTRKMQKQFPDLAKPAITPLWMAYTSYGIEAQVNGQWQAVPFEALQHPMEYAFGAVLRFTPPKGATALRGVADAPGRFEVRDSELCDNLFDRRNLHDLYPPKAAANFAPGAAPVPAATCVVGAAAGRPVKFDLDLRNFAWKTWWGKVRLEQFDAKGGALGSVFPKSLPNVEIVAGKRVQFREVGRLAPQATEVRLYLEGEMDVGGTPQLEIQSLNLRVAQVVPNAFTPEAPAASWIVPPATGRIDFSELDTCLASNSTTDVTRSGEGLVVTADTTLRTVGKTTTNSRSGSRPLALDLQRHTLTLDGPGRFLFGALNVKQPGNIDLSGGVHLAIEYANTCLNGSAANVLRCRQAGSLQFLDTAGELNWTLDASGLGMLRVWRSGKAKGFVTNVCYWAGPVQTGKRRLPIELGANSFSFRGPVSGAGLQITGDPTKKGYVGLFSPSNSFTAGVGVQDATLVVGLEGALPAVGGPLALTNANVRLAWPETAESGRSRGTRDPTLPGLQAVAMGALDVVQVEGGAGSWKSVVKRGKGRLDWNSVSASECLDVREGTVTVAFDATRRTVAGLLESVRREYPNAQTAQLFTDMAAHRMDAARVQLSPAAYYDGSHPFWTAAPPDANTLYRGMFAYTGYVWNNSPTNETWSFAGAAGTHLYVNINGRDVFRYTNEKSKSHGQAVLKPGANALDVRGYVFSHACKRMDFLNHSKTLAWRMRDFGLGYDPQGRNSTNQVDYLKLIDPGDGSLLTWMLPEKIVEGKSVPPGSTQVIRRTASFGTIRFAAGSGATFASGDYVLSHLQGLPKIGCRTRFTVAQTWQMPWAEVMAGGRLRVDGQLVLGARTLVSLTGKAPAADKTPTTGWFIAEAAGGIVLPDDVRVEKGYKLKLAADGKQLWLLRL